MQMQSQKDSANKVGGMNPSPPKSYKQAMKFFDVGRTTFYDYAKLHGLKSCGAGHKIKFHEDDLIDFLMSIGSEGECF